MDRLDRRTFLKGSLLSAAVFGMPAGVDGEGREPSFPPSAPPGDRSAVDLVDTNVHVLGWPFRDLKYGETEALVAKLRRHGVRQAWAGSFDALFHKNVDGVNARLVEECRRHGGGVLVPFGTVNPTLPDWEEDLRRCHERYGMAGIRLYPSFHGYSLGEAAFWQLLAGAAARGLVVQVAVEMEDERVHHPRIDVPAVDVTPLADALQGIRDARVVLVNPFRHVRRERLQAMVGRTPVMFEISNLEGTGGLERIMAGNHWFLDVSIPADRLLFGSHAPIFPLESSLFKLMESPLSTRQAAAIMHGNASKLVPGA